MSSEVKTTKQTMSDEAWEKMSYDEKAKWHCERLERSLNNMFNNWAKEKETEND